MEITFFLLLFLAIYPYSIYPGTVFLLSWLFGRSWQQGDITPLITIIISVYNEEKVIEEKINNTLSLEYPKNLMEVIVSSDGSNDKTNAMVSGITDSRLILQAFPQRSGKTACLNRVIPLAKGEIILFTDANSMFPSDTLLKIARNFADTDVGCVSGWTRYGHTKGGNETTGLYSKIEKWTKYKESLVSSSVGADGAVFAIRRSLFSPLDDRDINDFVIPLRVIEQGKRVILDPEVFCFENASNGLEDEYRRQVRITTRTLGAIFQNLKFLNPFSYGYFSFFLISHKLIRFLVPFLLMGTFGVNIMLLGYSPIYTAIFGGQILILCVGILSLIGLYKGRLSSFIGFFFITISAQFIAWFRIVLRKTDVMWNPIRR